jgi:predicted AlkP superfamily pyrophosphatase or phosphodiesterase
LTYAFSIRLAPILAALTIFAFLPPANAAERVILISVDGLRPDAVTAQGAAVLPNFYRFRTEGAITDNARADYDSTLTLPNHTSMITSRPVLGADGHLYSDSGTPTQTLHDNKGSYIASVFDVVHDAGLSTALYASKSKFSLYDASYDKSSGAAHPNGADKIDEYVQSSSESDADTTAELLVDAFVTSLGETTRDFSMLCIRDPDSAGHGSVWMGGKYLSVVADVDAMLGKVFELVDHDPDYKNKTVIILTTDHAGDGTGHGTHKDPLNYTIPFYVWGVGVPAGTDLYQINSACRRDHGTTRPDYTGVQPIRNSCAGNLALSLLGLGPIPGSTINADQSLIVTPFR